MKSLLFTVLLTLFFVLIPAASADFKLIEPDEVTINYRKYFDGGRDPILTQNLPGTKLGDTVQIILNTNVLKYAYWDNRVHGDTDNTQFRLVGWESKLGINILPYLSVEYYHHSQHVLDASWHHGGFPVMDAFSINIKIIDKRPRNSVF